MPLPCLKPRRSSKVCPAPNSSLDVDLVEVRKGRLLRIQHINPRLRNKQVPQSKHGKTQSPPLELHVPRVSFYGNKCIVTDAPTQNSNHVKKAGGGPSPNNNRVPALVSAHNSNVVRCVKSNHFPSNLSKEQKRMLFKMGVRSVSALKNMVLFFFHGVGGSSDIWQTQINYFSSLGFEIVAPDLIGHGMSEVPLKKRAYHFREILADVIAIFDRYCKKKNLVIGHSYGCAFTTVLARERARRVWRLIMISGGGPIPLAPEIGIFAFPLWFVSCIRPCLDQVFEKSAFKKKQKNEMLKRASFNIPSFVLHYIINGQDWPEGDEVYHSWISVPTLLINGRDDTFATLDDAKLMKATIHGSKLEIVDEASHMVMLEAPDKVNKLILDFICSRGSHKLPDVKESAEEGQESPMRTTQACTYSGGVGGGGGGGGKPIHPLYLPQHQHRAQEVGSGTPSRSPSPEILVNQFDIENYSQSPVMETPEEIPHYTQQPEVDMYAPTIYVEGSPSQDNSIPWQKWSKVQHGSSYDNASYESDESGEEYYYYKDQYGNHHYVSAKEYARQFPHNQTPPGDFRANEIDMEVSTVDIPAFEDISVDQSSPVDGTPTEEDSNSDYNSVNGYPVEVNANYPLDFDNDGSPGYIVPREARYYNPQCEPMEENEVCESPERSREIDDDLPPIFSIPELQFCEECIQNHNTERTTNCEKCIELNMVPPEYRNYQTTSCIRRQSVTLALGRQRSDSLDYLGQEQLIIITCYDETEDEEISISSSVDDTRVGPRRHSKDQQTNQNATRHNQRAGAHESEETVRKKSPTLPTLNEQEEEYSPGGSPVKKGKTHKGELYRSLHDELLAKVNKRNNLNEAGRAPQVDNKGSGANPPLRSAPSSGEGVVSRKNFLESKKLMEEHFSKTAFKMPALPSNSSSPCRDPTNRRPPKPLGPKPQRRNHSSSQLKREQSKETVASSSPSFLQSKRTIHEHFSKIGLGSPMTRPFSSPNLASYSNDINGASPQRERRLSPSSPSALTRKLTKSEENVTPDPEKSDEESSISQRLSVTEWTHTHINRVIELSSPENGETPKSEETPKSASAASRSTASGSASPVSTSLSVSDWAERHSRTIAASISPTGSPSRARPGPKQNVSPKVSPAKQTIEQDDSESKTSLSLNDWADRHLKLVTTRMSPSSPVSAQSENGLFRSSSGKEIPVVESANPLTLDDWAQRHLQRIAKMSKTVENENGIIDSKLTRSNQVTSEKNNLRPEALGTKPLTLTEWAERHVRKITELHSRSPKALQLKLADSESDEDSSVVRTPEGIAKPIVKPSFSVLNEWAEQHVRRISEQKLVAGMTKEETSVEKEGSGDTKEKQKTTTDISVNSQQEYETLPAHSDLEDTLTGSQIEHTSAVRDGEAPESRENCTNETEEESKTEDKCILDASTSNAPLLIRGTRSYETRISIDRSQNGGQLLEREKATLEGNEKGNLAIGNNANGNEKQKDICVPGQSEITGESSMSYPERSLSMRPIENEGHSLNRVENVLGVIKDESLIGAAKNVNEEKRPGNNRDLLACTSGMPQTTPERKYLLHRSPLNKPPQTEGCHLSRGNRATAAGENSSPTIGNDVNSEDKNTEICRSQNVGELGATQIDQELKSTLETGLSNTPFKASLPALNIDIDVALELCHETVIDSTPLEQLQRPLCQRRGSSSAAQSQLPPVHKQDSNNDNNNNNNNNNNGSNNNNNNNNTGQREAFSDIRVTRPTVDDNSNVVPTTSVSRGSSEGSVDKVQVSDEEQTGSCCQPADTTSVPTDNDNNRILSDSILVTTSDTDTQTLTNVSNVLAYTSTTTTTTSKN